MEPTIEFPVGLGLSSWSDEQRALNLQETLAKSPDPSAVWVFGYGSLIWDPRFEPAETRAAKLQGHRRSFCFFTTRGRGSPERPGLGLAIFIFKRFRHHHGQTLGRDLLYNSLTRRKTV